jgi:hypothetical protein
MELTSNKFTIIKSRFNYYFGPQSMTFVSKWSLMLATSAFTIHHLTIRTKMTQ